MGQKKPQFDYKKLYQLTEREHATLQVEKELTELKDVIAKNFSVKLCLKNIRLTSSQKGEVCLAILPPSASPITREIVKLLASRKLLEKIDELSRGFARYIAEKKQITFAEVKTAVPLSNKLKTKMEAVLVSVTKKPVILKQKIVPEVIGGFLIKVLGGTVIDATLKRRLSDLQNQIRGAEA